MGNAVNVLHTIENPEKFRDIFSLKHVKRPMTDQLKIYIGIKKGADTLDKRYEHIQIGYLTISALGIAILVMIGIMVNQGLNLIAFIGMIIVVVCLALFATLKTTIDDTVLELRFTMGIVRKNFLLKDIKSCQIVKNSWYYGWGMHLTPDGWLYNVSGFDAVKINMKTGKSYIIGTDVPDELAKAIEAAIEP